MTGSSSNFRRSPDCEMIRISADGKRVYKEKSMSYECDSCYEATCLCDIYERLRQIEERLDKMSGECPKCSEHPIDCICHSANKYPIPQNYEDEEKLKFALSFFDFAMQRIWELGYDVPKNIEFKKRNGA